MAEHGGYRKPANPAGVSGPGALSQRTDGGPGQPQMPISGLGYGENQAASALQNAAPMADQSDGGMMSPPSIVPLDAPTQRPTEPLTHGAPFGPGPGPAAQNAGRLTEVLMGLFGDDIVGGLEELYLAAEAQGL